VVEDIGAAEAGQTLTKEEVDEILIQLDANGDGTISFDGTRAS
jgi:Ca2+-binding EF-hand superfamily protein